MNEKKGYVYIMTNRHNRVLYAGVTSDLIKRVYEHKEKMREKQIKGWKREKKITLIEKDNPKWKDLYGSII